MLAAAAPCKALAVVEVALEVYYIMEGQMQFISPLTVILYPKVVMQTLR